MAHGLIVRRTIEINADISEVWNALINPELIKQYLFDTEAVSEWKVGSPIFFRGTWEGNTYEDKGIIIKLEKNKIFEYKYWSAYSGLEDKIENYATITNKLTEKDGNTLLTITQDHILTEEDSNRASEQWDYILKKIKEILE